VAQILLELLTPLLTIDYGVNGYIPAIPHNLNGTTDDDYSQIVEPLAMAPMVVPSHQLAAPIAKSAQSLRATPQIASPTPTLPLLEFDPQLTKDLSDTKLDLMRFANPLRAKILIFSQLYYGFIPDIHDWSDMRNHDLDFLLRQSFYSSPTYEILKASLLKTARSLPEPDAYEPIVSSVLRVLAPFYDLLKEKKMRHPAAEDSKGDDRLETSSSSITAGGDDDQTCQFVER
jgi:hypothetical protein